MAHVEISTTADVKLRIILNLDNRKMCTSREISATKPLHHMSFPYKLLCWAWLKFWLDFCASYSFDCYGKYSFKSILVVVHQKIISNVVRKCFLYSFDCGVQKIIQFQLLYTKKRFLILNVVHIKIFFFLQFWLLCIERTFPFQLNSLIHIFATRHNSGTTTKQFFYWIKKENKYETVNFILFYPET